MAKDEFADMPPFKKARYVKSTAEKGSYILYYVWDAQKNDLVRKRMFIPKKYKTPESQDAFAKEKVRQINKLLKEGYHIDKEKSDKQKRYAPDEDHKISYTVKEAIGEFLRIKESKRLYERGLRFYENTLFRFTSWLDDEKLGGIWLSELNHKMVHEYFTYLLVDRKYEAKTHNNALGVLKTFYNECLKQEWIEGKNPFDKIDKMPEDYGSKNKPFSNKQVADIKEYVLENDPYLWKIICFIYYSFFRPSEIRRLKVEDIDLENDLIWVNAKTSKTKKRDVVPIVPALRKIIEDMEIERFNGDFYLFGGYGTPAREKMGENFMNKHFRKVKEHFDLEADHTLYGFKHTAVVNWYKKEKDIRKIQKMCRHSTILMTERYMKSLGLLDDKEAVSELPEI